MLIKIASVFMDPSFTKERKIHCYLFIYPLFLSLLFKYSLIRIVMMNIPFIGNILGVMPLSHLYSIADPRVSMLIIPFFQMKETKA